MEYECVTMCLNKHKCEFFCTDVDEASDVSCSWS